MAIVWLGRRGCAVRVVRQACSVKMAGFVLDRFAELGWVGLGLQMEGQGEFADARMGG